MNKLDILMKAVGALVVTIIFWGVFNRDMMPILTPFILAGTAATLGLYVVNAFKTKNYAKMISILAVAAFVILIVGMKLFA